MLRYNDIFYEPVEIGTQKSMKGEKKQQDNGCTHNENWMKIGRDALKYYMLTKNVELTPTFY